MVVTGFGFIFRLYKGVKATEAALEILNYDRLLFSLSLLYSVNDMNFYDKIDVLN